MVKSLLDLCTSVCIKHIREITDVGTVPYPALRQILLKIDSAEQLHQLEIASPHLRDDDAECWHRLIERDFPVLSKKLQFAPRNEASWYKIYFKYKQIEDENKAAAEEKLKNAFAGIRKNKETNVSKIVDYDRRKLPRLPREGRNLGALSGRGQRGGPNDSGDLRFSGGSRTKVNSAQSILKKARREAKEIHARNRLATPTGTLPVQRGQITKAPQGMVEELRVNAQPKVRAPGSRIQAPRGGARQPHQQLALQRDRELEDREARLHKMKGGSTATKPTYLSDSELEGYGPDEYSDFDDDDDHHHHHHGGGGLVADDLEGIFGDEEEDVPKASTSSATVKQSSSAATAASPPSKAPAKYTNAHSSVYKRSGLLSNAPGSSPRNKIMRVSGKPSSSSTALSPPPKTLAAAASLPKSSSAARAASSEDKMPPPPARDLGRHTSPARKFAAASSSSPPLAATSPELNPQGSSGPAPLPRKRKPVDVFMKPKPKVQRR